MRENAYQWEISRKKGNQRLNVTFVDTKLYFPMMISLVKIRPIIRSEILVKSFKFMASIVSISNHLKRLVKICLILFYLPILSPAAAKKFVDDGITTLDGMLFCN